jgi:holin-like protein
VDKTLEPRQPPAVNIEQAMRQGLTLLRRSAAVVAQVSLLWVASYVGHEAVELAHLPLPGNVAGMLVMFAALSSGLLPLRFVEEGAGLLVRNLPLFFVPMAVGFLNQGHLLATRGVAIAVALVGSAAFGFAVTGRVAQYMTGRRRRSPAGTRRTHASTRRCYR